MGVRVMRVYERPAQILRPDIDPARRVLVVDRLLLRRLRLLDVVIEPGADVGNELPESRVRGRRNGEELQPLLRRERLEAWQILRRLRQVDLVRDEDLRAARDFLAVLLELCIDLVVVVDRVAALDARGVDDVQDELRALDVAQKVVAEADAIRRALDEAGDVRHDEALLIVRLDDAEHGRDRREMILGNLRPCR